MPRMAHSRPSSLAFLLNGSFFNLSQHLSDIGSSMYLLYFLNFCITWNYSNDILQKNRKQKEFEKYISDNIEI